MADYGESASDPGSGALRAGASLDSNGNRRPLFQKRKNISYKGK